MSKHVYNMCKTNSSDKIFNPKLALSGIEAMHSVEEKEDGTKTRQVNTLWIDIKDIIHTAEK